MDDFVLGDRELDVMGVLWDLGSGTVAEVREKLPVDLAYTTVLTILRNLEAKEFVYHGSEGKAHRYFPQIARRAAWAAWMDYRRSRHSPGSRTMKIRTSRSRP